MGKTWIAQQGSSPSGSYKELGAEVMAASAHRRGVRDLFLDSSGNAGIAVARACSERGIGCTVLVPEATPEAKKTRIRQWGGRVETIRGDRDATHRVAQEWGRNMPYAAPFFQPSFFLGVSTLAWDLWLAFAGHLPENWFLPVGNGPLFLGLAWGLEALRQAGKLDQLPAFRAVQLEGWASLYPEGPGRSAAHPPQAGGIAIGNPPRRLDLLTWMDRSGGDITRVSDEAIDEARRFLAEAGWPADPTGAAAWAGRLARPDLWEKGCLVLLTSREGGVSSS